MLLITLRFPLRSSAQAHQPPASGSHPLLWAATPTWFRCCRGCSATAGLLLACQFQIPTEVIVTVPLIPAFLYGHEEPGGHGDGCRAGWRVCL